MTGMLASVASLAEARQVREIGVDIVDLKNPAEAPWVPCPSPMSAASSANWAAAGRSAPLSAICRWNPMSCRPLRKRWRRPASIT
jgi:hypothetical protein